MSDNYSALDLSQDDITTTSDRFTKTSNSMHDSGDMDSTAESHEVTSKRQKPSRMSGFRRYIIEKCCALL